ncbi:hypothetical protein OOT46_21555 [Aquabacterium sp. A7-Y]|uniref:3-hydroxyacyl-ACP dehydratase FabZ family protein n=1 Tax=Aquabacterium sp. A7-Y TaxID=1349605 RepID=UPI00223CEECC|nr:FabA/FabZ family ACP-dehydratase [Aquabacterium sp. A7-Y]MCW7540418.1 hypothetical protein [Aquabacterium sp. A7-Y]
MSNPASPCAALDLPLEDCLPHRGAALFVQQAAVEGASIRGEACWSAEHPVLQGHFPGQAIVPGVFLIEAAAQLGGVWIARTHAGQQGLGVLASVRKALVHRLVMPQERVRYELQVTAAGDRFFSVRGHAFGAATTPEGGDAGDGKVLTIDLLIAVRTGPG